MPPFWLSVGGSSSRVVLGLGVYSFLGLLDASFILVELATEAVKQKNKEKSICDANQTA